MNTEYPIVRRDLDFIPVQHAGQSFILIRDHLGLVPEGKAVALPLYHFMTLLNGTRTLRDIQMELIRQQRGVLVGIDKIQSMLNKLAESCLLDNERFHQARNQIEARFAASSVRPCFQCGGAYPREPEDLKRRLDEILASKPDVGQSPGEIVALIAPHIDPSSGSRVYASAYQMLRHATPQRVVLLGVGHQMVGDMYAITAKDFQTPLGLIKNEPDLIDELRACSGEAVAASDFAHRSEHSIEFQLIFLQHLLADRPFTILPILCGSLQATLSAYNRAEFLQKAGPFLQKLREITADPAKKTLVVAGVDFSHIGPKFGHHQPARYLESRTTAHDQNLLNGLRQMDADLFWQESIRVEDRYNVCGFPAMACLLEIISASNGEVLDYQLRHESATQSAVSFAAVVFAAK